MTLPTEQNGHGQTTGIVTDCALKNDPTTHMPSAPHQEANPDDPILAFSTAIYSQKAQGVDANLIDMAHLILLQSFCVRFVQELT